MVAGLVRPGRPLADVGTDHAYLPAALLQHGVIPFAYCADLRSGPLQKAAETVARAGVSDRVQLTQSNGLAAFPPGFCQDFVLAGMGGNLMADILAASPWLREQAAPDAPAYGGELLRNHFVLQPQSHPEDLRAFLYANGFRIVQEQLCRDDGRLYLALEAESPAAPTACTNGSLPSPLAPTSGTSHDRPPVYPAGCYLGELLQSTAPEELKLEYFGHILNRLRKRLYALTAADEADGSGTHNDERRQLAAVLQTIEEALHG